MLRWPGQTHATQNATVQQDGIRPVEGDGLFGRQDRPKRIGNRVHDGIKRAAGAGQWLLGFQHHRELDRIKPAHPHERARTTFPSDRLGMRKSIAQLAKWHSVEAGR
jgi:hypothetical protein